MVDSFGRLVIHLGQLYFTIYSRMYILYMVYINILYTIINMCKCVLLLKPSYWIIYIYIYIYMTSIYYI